MKAIEKSAAAYMSGLRCWAAFNDALGCVEHFPAKPEMVEQFVAMFESTATSQQYLKHLRWAHRFFHMPNLGTPTRCNKWCEVRRRCQVRDDLE